MRIGTDEDFVTHRMDTNCVLDMAAFCRGGLPGMRRLKEVLPSIFQYHKVISLDEQEKMIKLVGLSPIRDATGYVTFTVPEPDFFGISPPQTEISPRSLL